MKIYSRNVDYLIKEYLKNYGKLQLIPKYLLIESVLNIDKNNIDNFEFEGKDLFERIEDINTYLLEKYNNIYSIYPDILWVFLDIEFDLDNRVGVWDNNKLILFIPIKNIQNYIKSKSGIYDWLRRGLSYYILKKINRNEKICKLSYNQNDYDFSYIFEVFLNIPDELENYSKFSDWWAINGVLFFRYIEGDILKISKKIEKSSLKDNQKLFFRLIEEYQKNITYDLNIITIGMCFHSQWYDNIKININEEITDDIYENLVYFLENVFEDFNLIAKNITMSNEKFIENGVNIIFEKIYLNEENKVKFEVKNISKEIVEFHISYSSLNFLNKVIKNEENRQFLLNSMDKKIIIEEKSDEKFSFSIC